ncbi:hypothetical protein DFH09DRAFT_1079275 [Mycena vulgaris]|nr:hypothetical protein DFH09DRAFT_1079275 [Mycena vulgaris]
MANMTFEGGHYLTALQAVVYTGRLDIVHLLLKKGEDSKAVSTVKGQPPVWLCLVHRVGEVQLPNRAQTCLINGTVLQAAAYWGCEDMVQLLLARGADVNAQGKDGGKYGTALRAAHANHSRRIAEFLLASGADPALLLSTTPAEESDSEESDNLRARHRIVSGVECIREAGCLELPLCTLVTDALLRTLETRKGDRDGNDDLRRGAVLIVYPNKLSRSVGVPSRWNTNNLVRCGGGGGRQEVAMHLYLGCFAVDSTCLQSISAVVIAVHRHPKDPGTLRGGVRGTMRFVISDGVAEMNDSGTGQVSVANKSEQGKSPYLNCRSSLVLPGDVEPAVRGAVRSSLGLAAWAWKRNSEEQSTGVLHGVWRLAIRDSKHTDRGNSGEVGGCAEGCDLKRQWRGAADYGRDDYQKITKFPWRMEGGGPLTAGVPRAENQPRDEVLNNLRHRGIRGEGPSGHEFDSYKVWGTSFRQIWSVSQGGWTRDGAVACILDSDETNHRPNRRFGGCI